MLEMWNERYAQAEYAYGTAPNVFLKTVIDKHALRGSMLFPAEGEGRNAVYAAKRGLEVYAFDISIEGRKKALKLADTEGVTINYEVGDFFQLPVAQRSYDAAALIYAHFPPPILAQYHRKIAELIKPGGLIIAEGFSKSNLPLRAANPKVGGPNNIEMLFSPDTFKDDFPAFEIIQLQEVQTTLAEGAFHNGVASVMRFVGRKI